MSEFESVVIAELTSQRIDIALLQGQTKQQALESTKAFVQKVLETVEITDESKSQMIEALSGFNH